MSAAAAGDSNRVETLLAELATVNKKLAAAFQAETEVKDQVKGLSTEVQDLTKELEEASQGLGSEHT